STSSSDARLATPGNSYRIVIVPATRRMPLATLAHLQSLIRDGVPVLFTALPEDVPGLGRLDSRRADFHDLLASPEISSAVFPGGLPAELIRRRIRREALADHGLEFIRRATAAGHDYFVTNLTAHP